MVMLCSVLKTVLLSLVGFEVPWHCALFCLGAGVYLLGNKVYFAPWLTHGLALTLKKKPLQFHCFFFYIQTFETEVWVWLFKPSAHAQTVTCDTSLVSKALTSARQGRTRTLGTRLVWINSNVALIFNWKTAC